MALRVKATATGFRDGSLVYAGAEFSLRDGERVPSWVEVLGGEEAPKKERKKRAESEVEPEPVKEPEPDQSNEII